MSEVPDPLAYATPNQSQTPATRWRRRRRRRHQVGMLPSEDALAARVHRAHERPYHFRCPPRRSTSHRRRDRSNLGYRHQGLAVFVALARGGGQGAFTVHGECAPPQHRARDASNRLRSHIGVEAHVVLLRVTQNRVDRSIGEVGVPLGSPATRRRRRAATPSSRPGSRGPSDAHGGGGGGGGRRRPPRSLDPHDELRS